VLTAEWRVSVETMSDYEGQEALSLKVRECYRYRRLIHWQLSSESNVQLRGKSWPGVVATGCVLPPAVPRYRQHWQPEPPSQSAGTTRWHCNDLLLRLPVAAPKLLGDGRPRRHWAPVVGAAAPRASAVGQQRTQETTTAAASEEWHLAYRRCYRRRRRRLRSRQLACRR
jgi:hypothetical protein